MDKRVSHNVQNLTTDDANTLYEYFFHADRDGDMVNTVDDFLNTFGLNGDDEEKM